MTDNAWMRWPSREALSRVGVHKARRAAPRVTRAIVLGMLVATTFTNKELNGWALAGGITGIVVCGFLAWGFWRTTLEHRLLPSLVLLALLLASRPWGRAAGFRVPALVLWCGCAVTAIERLPLAAALPATAVALSAYAAVDDDAWLTTAATTVGLALAGTCCGSTRKHGGAPSGCWPRNARPARPRRSRRRSRSAPGSPGRSTTCWPQSLRAAGAPGGGATAHREGADRDTILERVVAARGMARDGLAETRQALSALRGEMSPLEDFLGELVATADGAEVTVTGERQPLPAEASQAVRRVAQEALTNVRKHAPGAKIHIRLDYGEHEVTLDVRDSGGKPGELSGSGAGYGLLGMRERAELLGGSLDAGPGEEGFVVTLKVPV